MKHNEPKGSRGLTKPLANPRVEVKVGCWNVRTIYSVGKTVQNTREMNRYRFGILRISENACGRDSVDRRHQPWSGFGRPKTPTIVYSGMDDELHQSGVAIIMSRWTGLGYVTGMDQHSDAHFALIWVPAEGKSKQERQREKRKRTTVQRELRERGMRI